MMKRSEPLARMLVIVFVLVAIAIPFGSLAFFKQGLGDTIELHARMPENGGWSLENLTAEVGQPLHLRLTSDDVVHSFAIGQSDQAPIDIQPGETVETTLVFDRPGKYVYYCTHWCGPNHWRMRGTIDVTGPDVTEKAEAQPLFLQLKLDLDSPHPAQGVPQLPVISEHGATLASRLPAYLTDPSVYQVSSPSALWQKLRAEPSLKDLADADLWDAVAWAGQNQAKDLDLEVAQNQYATNCAACHGETGKGDGVIVRGLPVMQHDTMGQGLVRPPDFTDPTNLLGASPAILKGKMIRGGMGTGMPYWGPIFTGEQMDALVSDLYSFAFASAGQQKPDSSQHHRK